MARAVKHKLKVKSKAKSKMPEPVLVVAAVPADEDCHDYWDQPADRLTFNTPKIEFRHWLRSQPWLRWWYIWLFRRSLAKASMGYRLQAGWRRRCLNAVKTGKITGTDEKRGLTDYEATVVVARAVARRVLPVVRFWRKMRGGWLDNIA